ncbi:MAG: response regulator transcription factor [Verrucomicrobiota bacterium]
MPKAEPEEVTLKALDLVFAGGSYFPTIVYQEREETGEDSHQRTGGGTEGVNLPALTQRQRQILDLLAQGHSNKEIAYRLNMREATIRVHMSNLFKRLGVTSRTQAALLARGHGSSP